MAAAVWAEGAWATGALLEGSWAGSTAWAQGAWADGALRTGTWRGAFSDLRIPVLGAAVSFAPADITLRQHIVVTAAATSIAGQIIGYQLGNGPWVLPVTAASISPTGQDVVGESANFFAQAEFSIVGKQIALPIAMQVLIAEPGILGSDITLTWDNDYSVFVDPAAISPTGQTVGLQQSWSITVDAASLTPIGSDVSYAQRGSIAVSPASLTPTGQSVGLHQRLYVTAAAIAPSGSTIPLDKGLTVTVGALQPAGQVVTLSRTFELGINVVAASLTFTPADVGLFYGSGLVKRIKLHPRKDNIELAIGLPVTEFAQSANRIEIN